MSSHTPDKIRRQLLTIALWGSGVAMFPHKGWAAHAVAGVFEKDQTQTPSVLGLIGNALDKHQFYSIVVNLAGEELHRIPLPDRGHGIAISQQSRMGFTHAVAFARRPGHYFKVFDYQTGETLALRQASHDRYFYGHGVFSPDGRYLLATEGKRKTSEGLIGVYDVQAQYQKVDEWQNLGIGPHEIINLGEAGYAVAVGGVHTDGRRALNLDSMQPALLRLDLHGKIRQQKRLADPQLSIRHLSYGENDVLVAGQQYRGDPDDYPPLVVIQKGTQDCIALQAEPEEWARFHHYIASIALLEDFILVTSPPGNCYGIWSLSKNQLLELNPLSDASGVVAYDGHFYISAGSGEMINRTAKVTTHTHTFPFKWDNHWNAIRA